MTPPTLFPELEDTVERRVRKIDADGNLLP